MRIPTVINRVLVMTALPFSTATTLVPQQLDARKLTDITCFGQGRDAVVLSARLRESNLLVALKLPYHTGRWFICGQAARPCSKGDVGAEQLAHSMFDLITDRPPTQDRELEALLRIGHHRHVVPLIGRALLPLNVLHRLPCLDKFARSAYSRRHGSNATVPSLVFELVKGLRLSTVLHTLWGTTMPESSLTSTGLESFGGQGMQENRTCCPRFVAATAGHVNAAVGSDAGLEPSLWEIMIGLARALEHLHRRGVMHGDLINENNMIVRPSGELVLIDFSKSFRCSPDSAAIFHDVFWFGAFLSTICYGRVRQQAAEQAPALVDLRPGVALLCDTGHAHAAPVRVLEERARAEGLRTLVNGCTESIQHQMDELIAECTTRIDAHHFGSPISNFSWTSIVARVNEMRSRSPSTPLRCLQPEVTRSYFDTMHKGTHFI